jgi:hypothetical protein
MKAIRSSAVFSRMVRWTFTSKMNHPARTRSQTGYPPRLTALSVSLCGFTRRKRRHWMVEPTSHKAGGRNKCSSSNSIGE